MSYCISCGKLNKVSAKSCVFCNTQFNAIASEIAKSKTIEKQSNTVSTHVDDLIKNFDFESWAKDLEEEIKNLQGG